MLQRASASVALSSARMLQWAARRGGRPAMSMAARAAGPLSLRQQQALAVHQHARATLRGGVASAAFTTAAVFLGADVHAEAAAAPILELHRAPAATATHRRATTLATAAASAEADGGSDSAATGAASSEYPQIILYQYKICPYCNKVKAVLDYLGIPYAALEVNPVSKAEIKGDDFDGYKKVPVCRIAGEQINDSPVILGRLLELAAARGDAAAAGAMQDAEQKRWMEWVDRRLAVLLFPNITRSMTESMQAFAYIWDVPHFTTYDKVMNRFGGAVAMRLAQGKIKKKYDIDDEREALDAVIVEWTEAVGTKKFLTGDTVTVADLCVFGCLRAIEDMDTHRDVLDAHAPLRAWYERVAAEVGDSACTEWK